ncbi:MAG: hypothetical protein WBS24_03430 [Terriglobales bacterium]
MSNGFFSIQGQQTGTAQGSRVPLGPFNVPFGDVTDIQTVTVNTTATIAVPAGALGVAITPPIGNTTPSLKFKTVSGDQGTFIGPGQPTVIEFDPANLPADVYLVSGGSVVVVVQFL